MRIGDAAARLGLAGHVLRHWEDEGLLQPARTAGGDRVYDDETLTRARLIGICRRALLSVPEVRELLRARRRDRPALVLAKRAALAQRMADLAEADRFLAHVLECRHALATECPECSAFAGGPATSAAGPGGAR
jgi:MerR family copper efflux transcriptional regulator